MNKYEIAIQGDRLIDSTGIGKRISKMISTLCALKGHVMDGNDLTLISIGLTKDLKERFGGLTIEEVDIALNNGVRGDYGVYYGLNLITFLDWIKAYSVSNARINAKVCATGTKCLPPVSEVYEYEAMKNMSLRSFDLYRERNDVGFVYVTVYQFLQKIGLINQSKEFKCSVMDKLKEKSSLEKSNKYALAKPIYIDDAMIKLKAQGVCLAAYYDELIGMDVMLSDVIESYELNRDNG